MSPKVPGVSGVPDMIASGATQVGKVANAVESTSSAYSASCSQASSAAGDVRVSAAVDRFKAAFTHYSADLAAQLGALCMLAQHSAEDLATAGGTGGSRPR